MKNFISLLFIAYSITSFSQKIEVYPSYCRFNNLQGKPYIETYMAVNSNSVAFQGNEKGTANARLKVITTLSQNGQVKAFSNYEFNSPEKNATDTAVFTFINQERMEADNGKYEITMEITDLYKPDNKIKFTDSILIDFPKDELSFSDIELLENYKQSSEQNAFTKSGYELTPYLSDFFPEKVKNLKFYCEIYNADKLFGSQGAFLVTYYIRVFETQKMMSSFSRSKKFTAQPVNPILAEIPIQELPSGNFELVIEIRDKTNNLIRSNTMFFQRSNPKFRYELADVNAISTQNTWVDNFKNADSLKEHINSLRPISNQSEILFVENNFKKNPDFDLMKKYFLRFWEARNAADPEGMWKVYYEEVKYVNSKYGTKITRGYATDRGRVYLQYGPPNHIAKSDFDPNTVTYEIWHYYRLNNQRNRKFVFATQDPATNDMELVHSDAIGEYTDKNWLSKIRDDKVFEMNGNNEVERSGSNSVFGDRFRQSFINPH